MTNQQHARPELNHDEHAAALSQASAIRALHAYRSARDRAEWRGAVDTALLIEPPSFAVLSDAYDEVVEQYLDRSVKSPRAARSAVDLLAAILSEQQTGEILDEGGPVSTEKDRGDALRLLASLSAWVNDLDIADALREERERGGLEPRAPFDEPADKAELRRRALEIVAEFGGIPEATDDGIVEAERRLHAMRTVYRALAKAFPWDVATEEEIIEPTLTAAENALVEFIEDTPAEGLKAAAVKLRELIVGEMPKEAAALRQVLDVIERQAAGGAA